MWEKMALIIAASALAFIVGGFCALGYVDTITKHDCDHFGRLYLENVEYSCVRVPL